MSSIHDIFEAVDRFLKQVGPDLMIAIILAAVLTGALKFLLNGI